MAVLAGPWALSEELIKVRGTATANGAGLAARDKAIAKAQRRVLTELLAANLAVRHLPALNDLIDKAPQYVRSTQVIRQNDDETGVTVEVECFLDRTEVLRAAAKALLPRLPVVPEVLIVLVEQAAGEGPRLSAASTAYEALAKAFEKAGLRVVDPAEVRARYSDAELVAFVRGGSAEASRFAQEHLADAVILGEVTLENERSGNANIWVSEAILTLRIFRTADGKLVDTLGKEACVNSASAAEGTDWAVRDACEKVGDDAFLLSILAVVSSPLSDDVVLTLENPGAPERVAVVEALLEAQPGVERVQRLFYSEGLARLRVKYGGSMGDLITVLVDGRYGDRVLETQRAVARQARLRFCE